jgi:regulator of protease activity HflC (stomatin/prohibitin superfamily)
MSTGVVVLLVIAVLVLVGIAVATMIEVVQEYERGVIFRLGRVLGRPKGPGLILILPFGIDRMRKVTLQVVAMNVPPQDVITKDNVTMRVDAVVYSRIVDPVRAVVEVQNYLFATSQSAQTNLRAILGKYELDTLLAERERINRELRQIIARITHDWGVEVQSVEVKDVDLPDDLRRAMAREAEADREARALLIKSDAELRASRVLSEAAAVMAQHPQAMQLRFLQTVAEVATEQNSTLVMPVPIDLLSLLGRGGGAGADPDGRPAIPSPPAPSGAADRPTPQGPPGPDDERRPGDGNGRPG